MARDADWSPSGFEPCELAAAVARFKGFDVRSGWSLEDAGFPESHFAVITAIDSFYYVWKPLRTLEYFHQLLKPGGVLAMRISNKRSVLGFVRACSVPGRKRNARISRTLQAQFHSINLKALEQILRTVGFDRVYTIPRAMTSPWRFCTWRTRLAYFGSDVLYATSLGSVNVYPGVIVIARKAI